MHWGSSQSAQVKLQYSHEEITFLDQKHQKHDVFALSWEAFLVFFTEIIKNSSVFACFEALKYTR